MHCIGYVVRISIGREVTSSAFFELIFHFSESMTSFPDSLRPLAILCGLAAGMHVRLSPDFYEVHYLTHMHL